MHMPCHERGIALPHRPLSARTLSRLEDVSSIESAWRALDAKQNRATFFQSADWCVYVWRTRDELGCSPGIQHRIIVVEDATGIVCIWPLAISFSIAGRFAYDMGEPFGQYSDILLAPHADPEVVLAAALVEVSSWRIDGLVLRRVRSDSPMRPWLESSGVAVGRPEQAPAIDLATAGGHDAYRKGLNAKTRKNLRNYRNRLGREGSVVHQVFADPKQRAEAVERCFGGRSDWLADSGLSSTAFSDPAFPAIVSGLTHGLRGAPPVVAMRLALSPPSSADQSTDLSLHWGFEHQGRYYAYMSWKNPDYDGFSPGRLHLEDVVAAAAARGASTVDLLAPAFPYKVSLSSTVIDVQAYAVPFSVRGRLLAKGWHGTIRPRMKAALLSLPPPLRRVLVETPQKLKQRLARILGRRTPPATPIRA